VTPVRIQPARAHEAGAVLALIEALLAELGDEGQEFAQIDRDKLEGRLEREMAPAATLGCDSDPGSGRFLALLARDESGIPVGVLTLSTSFAVYAGGEYGVIDEMYVAPEYRSQGIGRGLVEAAVVVARRRGWFRLDVTGPVGAGAAVARASGGHPGAGGGGDADGTQAIAHPVLRFYRRLGFEPTGQKLRLLV
jgi:GNAT superfamily N-acetyltransferase